MANATSRIQLNRIGLAGRRFHVPMQAATKIFEGTMVAQAIADGMLVPATTAGAGPAIGKALHDVDNAAGADGVLRCAIETDAIYAMAGSGFSEASLIGAPVYAVDDHTVINVNTGGLLQKCGTFQGMEADGKIRVAMSPAKAGGDAAPSIQVGVGTLASGVLTVNTGITVTANSRIFTNRVDESGTDGDEIRAPSADRTVGGPGVGEVVFRAFQAGVAATSDDSTFEYMIVG